MKARRSLGAKALVILMALTMFFAMATSAFAADNTGGTPVKYNPDAHITVGKTLTATQAGIWPDVTQFQFTLTAVGYTPGPDSAQITGGTYSNYTKADLPMPAAGAKNTAAAADASGALAETVTVDGFSAADTGTTQSKNSVTGDIHYTQTGVYTYTLKEIIPTTRVPGVKYDETLYYVNVYVTNILDSNNSPVLDAAGKALVNVSNITAYKGTNGMLDPTAADFGGVAAAASADDAKVDIVTPDPASDGDVRNISYPFRNAYVSNDLMVSKKVVGTLADPQKDFTFSIALIDANGTADAHSYSYAVKTMGADQIAYNADDTAIAGKTGTIGNGGTFTLKHNQYIDIIGVPDGEKYTVTETGAQDYTTAVTPQNGTAQGTAVNGKACSQQTLSTAAGDVNHTDFVNTKNVTPPTGIVLDMLPYALIVGLAAAALVMVARKRRYNER